MKTLGKIKHTRFDIIKTTDIGLNSAVWHVKLRNKEDAFCYILSGRPLIHDDFIDFPTYCSLILGATPNENS